jgi:hypothetical protein
LINCGLFLRVAVLLCAHLERLWHSLSVGRSRSKHDRSRHGCRGAFLQRHAHGRSQGDDEQILRVVNDATLTGRQLIDWLNNCETVHFLHPESAYPTLTDSELVRVCLLGVAGFHPPGPPGHDASPNGAIFELRAGQDAVVDVIGDVDRLRILWDKLPT